MKIRSNSEWAIQLRDAPLAPGLPGDKRGEALVVGLEGLVARLGGLHLPPARAAAAVVGPLLDEEPGRVGLPGVRPRPAHPGRARHLRTRMNNIG